MRFGKLLKSSDIPVAFFARLLWQESRFRSGEVSRAGAQGVAQFMPSTAAEIGLDNPFDPYKALPASAKLLQKLRRDFGNLGLAAAAYNAGQRTNPEMAIAAEFASEGNQGLCPDHYRQRRNRMDG